MKIKLVAVDMDGTFLRSDNTYDKKRFQVLYEDMKKHDIIFVVASGNQYYQLRSFFPEIHQELCFVSDNGGYIVDQNEDVFVAQGNRSMFEKIIADLSTMEELQLLICGKENAYTNTRQDWFYKHCSIYYYNLVRLDSLLPLPQDIFFKIAMNVSVETLNEMMVKIQKIVGDHMVAISSGHGDIDLILPGVHKANALQILGKKYGIEPQNMIAFGDSGNDKEMLEYVSYSYVMENAAQEVKKIAKFQAPNHEDNGVLSVLEIFMKQGWEVES